MNNDNDLNLHSMTKLSSWLRYCFLVEHNLLLATAVHTGNLFKAMFQDSKIANKYKSGRTKTSHIANWISSKAP